jgi:branched-chain amino acid transport system permease protein
LLDWSRLVMANIIIQILLLVVWLGAGAFGLYRLSTLGYNVKTLRNTAFYVAPVLVVLYLIINQIQGPTTEWPANIPVCTVNVALAVVLIMINPVWLLASFLAPNLKGLDRGEVLLKKEAFSPLLGWLIFGAALLDAFLFPLVALQLFNAAPRYDAVANVVVNGVLNGFVFALVALGYTLVYGIVELINFAHGDVFMIGTMVGFFVITSILSVKPGQAVPRNADFFTIIFAIVLAMIISTIVCALLNFSIDRIAYKRLRNAPRLAPLITAIGFSFILQNIALYINSSTAKGYPLLFPNDLRVANVDVVQDWFGQTNSLITFPVTAFLVIFASAVLLLGLRYLINSTKTGKAMRAVAQSREAAALMGISIERTIGFAFLLGGGLAGAAGVIFGVYQVQSTVRYDLGFIYGLFAFTSAVLGGIGNVNGALLGGMFIGLIYSLSQSSFFGLTSSFLSLSIWAPVAVFGILVLVMVFRPTGILGDNTQEKV